MQNILTYFHYSMANQKGAMFGMDARVALIIASVLAAAGGTTMMSKLERSRQEGAERGVAIITDALEDHYKSVGITTLSPDIATLFTTGFIEESTLQTDPWNNNWNYNVFTKSLQFEDVPVTVNLAVVHSNGRDGVDDSVTVTTEAEWDAWVPAGDDIGLKFSTIEIEKKRVSDYRERGKLIIDKLQAYEAAQYIAADTDCTAAPCINYNALSPQQFNYYPIENGDANSTFYDDAVTNGAGTIYISGNQASMEALMTAIGLPTAYALDPWGRILRYDPNVNNRTVPPFSASVWYQ